MPAISIAIVSDSKQVVQDVKNLAGGYQNLADQLRRLGPDGEQAGDELVQALERAQLATRDSQTAVGELGQAYGRAKTVMASSSLALDDTIAPVRESYKAVGEEVEKIGPKSEIAGKLGEEAMMNLGFSAMSAGEVLQGPSGILSALGGFLAFGGTSLTMIPGIGMALAALATVGGLAMSVLGESMGETEQKTEGLDQAVSDLVAQMDATAASTKSTASSVKSVDDILSKAASSGTVYGTALAGIREAADGAGVSTTELTLAMAGQPEALTSILGPMRQYVAGLKARVTEDQVAAANVSRAGGKYSAAAKARTEADQKQLANGKQIVADLEKRSGALRGSAKDEDQVTAARAADTAATKKQTAAQKANAAAVKAAKTDAQAYTTALDESVRSAGADIDSFTKKGVINLDRWEKAIIDAAKGAADTTRDINKAMTQGMSQAGEEYAESLGPAFGRAYDQAVKEGHGAVSKLVRVMNEAGAASGVQYGDELRTHLPHNPTVHVKVTDDSYAARIRMHSMLSQPVYVPVIPYVKSGLKRSMVMQ